MIMTTETRLDTDPAALSSAAPAEEVNRIFGELRELKRACSGADGHSRAIVLIHACIDNGINTRARIRGTMEKLGFNADHAVMTLNKATGNDPTRHHWHRNDAGVYVSHAVGIAKQD